MSPADGTSTSVGGGLIVGFATLSDKITYDLAWQHGLTVLLMK